jgi:hypothetical protein
MPRQAETIPDRDEFASSTGPFRRELVYEVGRAALT